MGIFDEYLQSALIPALNATGVEHVGVFTEMGMSEPPKLHLLLPYASLEAFAQSSQAVMEQSVYQENSKSFQSATPDNPHYARYQSTLMRAFEALPQMKVPESGERIFELRSYEGFNDDAVRRKIAMFNDEEMPIFNKTGLDPVFFGEVLIGQDLPLLTYMITFRDIEERDANWKKFIDDPDWKRVSGMPKYANSVSRIQRTFLKPTDYSQV